MNASEIKFGVEVECYLPNEARMRVGAYHVGTQISRTPTGWNAQRDGSIRPDLGYYAAEVVSAPLAGELGLAEVAYVLDFLTRKGAKVNGSCGLHVHVDATNLAPDQIRAITTAFQIHELAFFALNGARWYERWVSSFCRPSPAWDGTRFQSLNTTNVGRPRKNTVEFRMWVGSLDAAIVLTAIHMAVGLVAAAAGNVLGFANAPAAAAGSPTEAAARFINAVWMTPTNLIIPEESAADLVQTLTGRAFEALPIYEDLEELARQAQATVASHEAAAEERLERAMNAIVHDAEVAADRRAAELEMARDAAFAAA